MGDEVRLKKSISHTSNDENVQKIQDKFDLSKTTGRKSIVEAMNPSTPCNSDAQNKHPLVTPRKNREPFGSAIGGNSVMHDTLLTWLTIERKLEEEWEKVQNDSLKLMMKTQQRHGQGQKEADRLTVGPYENNRVKLRELAQSEDSEDVTFINASYVAEKSYIAAAMPYNELTERDFWRMLYEQRCPTVIMLNRPGEQKKRPYWPKEINVPVNYGSKVTITKLSDTYNNNISTYIRKFRVELREGSYVNLPIHRTENGDSSQNQEKPSSGHIVTHMQFDAWEDMRIPDDKKEFVQFVSFVDQHYQDTYLQGPMVVHCFGGAGRTGTFLTIHFTLQKMKRFGGRAVDIFQLLTLMRNERASLVQTSEQYKFCYRVILDLYESRQTFNRAVLGDLLEKSKQLQQTRKMSRQARSKTCLDLRDSKSETGSVASESSTELPLQVNVGGDLAT